MSGLVGWRSRSVSPASVEWGGEAGRDQRAQILDAVQDRLRHGGDRVRVVHTRRVAENLQLRVSSGEATTGKGPPTSHELEAP